MIEIIGDRYMTQEKKEKLVQCAGVYFNIEGDQWTATFQMNNRKGESKTFLAGSIYMGLVKNNPEMKQAFTDLVSIAVIDFIKEVSGVEASLSEILLMQ